MEKTENGFVRMDTETGEMSICAEQAGNLVCRLSADERRAYDERLAELSSRVDALEQRLELMDPPSAIARSPEQEPDEAELDRAVETMEKVMRRFFGMVEDLQREFGDAPKTPPKPLAEPVPDRT
ncbi:hypothetical protein AWJ14_20035 [Hoeflea olei]|uniref:Uncharacterized protein n=1 Tax=Hoeflea olei TaxID=1480615 RepID=A0A1C1YS73_9HYPH|nr:hypothetical protein AWJ14_20035 [Hoeflea olei]